MNKNKNKKKILMITGLSLMTVLGGTLAYFNTSGSIENTFKTGKFQNTIVEQFVSPTEWKPGNITQKEVKVTNTGNMDMAVRASYTEKWLDSNGNELSLEDESGNVAAIINFNEGWTKDSDGYYYYGEKSSLTKLKADETSSSFINSVKFNEKIEASLDKKVSEDGQTITFESKGDGYDNAKYILTIKVETTQYDEALDFWK